MPEWARFTRRTNDPKLRWLEGRLRGAGIQSRRNGESFHAPILEVEASRIDDAWALLPAEIDDAADDDPMFLTALE